MNYQYHSEPYLYLPTLLKILLLLFMSIGFIFSITMAVYFSVVNVESGFIVVALTLTSTSITGILVFVVVVYSRRNLSPDQLMRRIFDFLNDDLPDAFRRMDIVRDKKKKLFELGPIKYDIKKFQSNVVVKTDLVPNAFTAYYEIMMNDVKQFMWIELNVYYITIIYYFYTDNETDTYMKFLEHAFEGAKKAGYECRCDCDEPSADDEQFADTGKRHRMKVFLYRRVTEDILFNSVERLHLANDVAVMTQAVTNGVRRQKSVSAAGPSC